MKLALQMYTLRDAISDEATLIQALGRVKEMGYEGVEFAGYFGVEPEQLAQLLAELGLEVVGSHAHIDALEKDAAGILDYSRRLGNKKVSMAWSPANSPAELKRTLAVLADASQKAESAGIQLLYHNHDHEFKSIEGKIPLTEIAEAVPLEVDCYWVFFAGHDPADFIRDNADSIGLLHIKDGGSKEPSPCAVGEGECDIPAVVDAARQIGAEWLIVENDNPVPTGFEDAARSIAYLKSLPV